MGYGFGLGLNEAITEYYESQGSDALLHKVNNCGPRDILISPIKYTV